MNAVVTGERRTAGEGRVIEADRASRADAAVLAAGALLVLVAALTGWLLLRNGTDIFLGFPPLLASWAPHVGPGTPFALATALAVVTGWPGLARRMAWRPLLLSAWAAAVAWTLSLAMVDGWRDGVVARLTSDQEYLWDVGKVADIGQMLRTFADHILTEAPEHWTTHVGAHPPGVFLLFVWLDRIGLGGGGPAGLLVALVGASACVAVAVTLRALGAEETARAVLPFGVLFPGAVWVGVSADGMFAAVLAWGVALLALGASGHGWRADGAALAGGLVLGWVLYLSYGLVLGGLLPLAVLAATRRYRAAVIGLAGVLVVVAAFTAAGFWWFTGFGHLRVIYAESAARGRPYWYFLFANLAALLCATGPAVLAGLRRFAVRPRSLPAPAALLAGAAVAAVALADLSGLSKAEVERIWLPFGTWLVVCAALLPVARMRGWLAAQALTALAVNHLLFTIW